MLSPAVKNFAIVCMAFTLFFTPFFSSERWVKAMNLSIEHQRCKGVITAVVRSKPTKLSYRFEVAGKTYEGATEDVFIGPRYPGNPVNVYYAPQNPELSTVTPPSLSIQEESFGILFAAASATFFLLWRFTNKKSSGLGEFHQAPLTGHKPKRSRLTTGFRVAGRRKKRVKQKQPQTEPALSKE